MEDMTEVKEKNMKLGGGIITVSIIYLVINVTAIFSTSISLRNIDELNMMAAQAELPGMSKGLLILSIALNILMILSIALILCKKAVGVYMFIGVTILNIISTIISNGFNLLTIIGVLIGLIFPGLLLFFVYRKKHIYFKN